MVIEMLVIDLIIDLSHSFRRALSSDWFLVNLQFLTRNENLACMDMGYSHLCGGEGRRDR